MIGIGGEGILRDLENVTFAPDSAIEWGFTLELKSVTITKDDGQVVSGS